MATLGDKPVRGRGFTLVELIAVIVVLAVIAGVAVPKFVQIGDRARASAYASHTVMMRRIFLQYEMEIIDHDPTFQFEVNATNFATSPLAGRFSDNPFKAFGGSWTYIYATDSTGGGMRSHFRFSGVPRMGEFPQSANVFYQIVASRDADFSEFVDGSVNEEPNYSYANIFVTSSGFMPTWSLIDWPDGPAIAPGVPQIEMFLYWQHASNYVPPPPD